MVVMQTNYKVPDVSENTGIKQTGNKTDKGTEFNAFMKKSAGTGESELKTSPATAATGKLQTKGSRDISAAESESAELSDDSRTYDDIKNDVFDALYQIVCQVVQAVSEITGDTYEQTEQMLAQYTGSLADVLDGSGVKELIMYVNDVQDASELLVNQDLYSQMQKLLKCMDDIEIQSVPDLMKLIESGNTGAVDEDAVIFKISDIIQTAQDVFDTALSETTGLQQGTEENIDIDVNVMMEKTANSAENETPNRNLVQDNGQEVQMIESPKSMEEIETSQKQVVLQGTDSENVLEDAQNETLVTEINNTADLSTDVSNEENHEENGSGHSQSKDSFMTSVKENIPQTGNIVGNIFQSIKDLSEFSDMSEAGRTTFASRILNQLVEGIKVMTSESMTSMEMQLNPESLGRISVQVVTKNGVVTAQIAAQNEAVREAIENQVTVLRQNMEEQGIRVEDVEVTVSSHAFEQGTGDEQNDTSDERQKRRRASGNVNSGVAADIKAVREEVAEEIIREQKGSTVSYSA